MSNFKTPSNAPAFGLRVGHRVLLGLVDNGPWSQYIKPVKETFERDSMAKVVRQKFNRLTWLR